jgi:hypothetical protein
VSELPFDSPYEGKNSLKPDGDNGLTETYSKYVQVSADAQFIENPGYNRDRGAATVVFPATAGGVLGERENR